MKKDAIVTCHFTEEQWDFLFYMLNQSGDHVTATVHKAIDAMCETRQPINFSDACLLRARIISQIINAGHVPC